MRRIVIAVFGMSLILTQAVFAAEADKVIQAAEAELNRAVKGLKTETSGPPYFVLYRITYSDVYNIIASYGGIISDNFDQWGQIYTEVRVGDYQFDNSSMAEEFDSFGWFFGDDLYNVPAAAPLNRDPLALRTILWLLTDENYRKAASAYFKKKGRLAVRVKDPDTEGVPAFSKETPSVYIGPATPLRVNAFKWRKLLRKASERFFNCPSVLYSSVRMNARRQQIYIINSEGTRIRYDRLIYSVSVYGMVRTDDGDTQTFTKVEYARDPSRFTAKFLAQMVDQVCEVLERVAVAPIMDPYTGPVLLMPAAAGVLFHEAVGHRLEGERQLSPKEGRTFKGKVGQKVIPEFLTLIDDPTLPEFEGKMLMGYYPYDDEGVKAQRVVLIERGVLKNYLMSRTPIKGFLHSNGHGRADATSKPRGRMGNLIVEAAPEKQVSLKQMEKRLIEEVKRQGKPYGIIISELSGGNTNTSAFGYQAFKGLSKIVWRIYPDGKKELVRGVDIVGTPLSAVNKIILASKERDVFNGYCGAESGMIPVSAVAPALLLSELEFQRSKQDRYPKPVLPSPYNQMHSNQKRTQ